MLESLIIVEKSTWQGPVKMLLNANLELNVPYCSVAVFGYFFVFSIFFFIVKLCSFDATLNSISLFSEMCVLLSEFLANMANMPLLFCL